MRVKRYVLPGGLGFQKERDLFLILLNCFKNLLNWPGDCLNLTFFWTFPCFMPAGRVTVSLNHL